MRHARRLALVTLVLALAAPLRAHAVTPASITMTPGSTDFIYVVDAGACAADITATSTNPAIEVYALNMTTGAQLPGDGITATGLNRIDQVFRVIAPTAGTPVAGTIEICWVGENYPYPPCNENNCAPYVPEIVNVVVNAPALGGGNRLSSGIVGDPINTSSGELFFREPPDLNLRGRLPLGFQRYFGGQLELDGVGPGPLGENWRHAFEWSWESVGNAMHFTTPTGRTIRFETEYLTSGVWTQAGGEDVPYTLLESGTDFVLADTLSGRMYTFKPTGKLRDIEDQNGNVLALTYVVGRLDQVTDGLGRTLNFSYGGSGELASVTDGTRSVTFTYTAGGSLETVTDTESNVTTYAYDATYPTWLASKTLPEGNVRHVQTYTPAGKVATQTAAGGHTTSVAYVSADTTITDPLTNTQVHTHTSQGEMTAQVDESALSAPQGYDAQGRRTSVTDRKGNVTSWTWHASGKVAQMVEADGRTTSFGYTARVKNGFTFFDLTSLTRADGASETFSYDADGNLTGHVDPRGKSWSWTYDGAGNVLTSTNPTTGVTTFTWNGDGTLDTSTDDAGNLTTFDYDTLRRVTTVTQADATTLAYTYDSMDRVLTITDELAGVTTFVYDQNGNLTSVTAPEADTWGFSYDAMDRLETVTDPLTRTMTATFDELGRPQTITNGNGKTTTYAFDAVGNLASVTDAKGKTWTRGYDAEHLLVSATNPLSQTIDYTVDAMGRCSDYTTPLGSETTFAYDALGRVTQVRCPSMGATTFAYDALGLVSSIALPGGATSSFGRNALGLVTLLTDPRGNPWLYAYDDQGRRTTQIDPLGNQATYQYDQRNRVSQANLPGGLGTVDVTYDGAGRVTQRAYSDGTTLDLAYDANGRVTSGSGVALGYDAAGRMTSSNGITVSRNTAGQISQISFAPGKFVNYTYDDAGRLAMIFDWSFKATLFTFNDAGQLMFILRGNNVNTLYTLDVDGRISRILEDHPVDHTVIDQILTRDADGRITNASRMRLVTGSPAVNARAFAYDAAGQIVGYTYDAMGRLTADGTRTYAWNLASQLTSYTEAGSTASYTYDTFGNVLSRTEGGTTDEYVWNYALELPSIAARRQGGIVREYFVHTPGGDLLYSVNATTGAHTYYHYDESGNTLLLTNDASNNTDAWHHTPAGVELARMGTTSTRFTFGGQFGVMQESSSGLYRMRARLYDAVTGRFISRDAVEAGDPRGVNPYQYAYGNPLRYVDPRGTTPQPAGGGLQVHVESRFTTVTDNFVEDIGLDFRGLGEQGPLQSGLERIADDAGSRAIGPMTVAPSPLDDLALSLVLRSLWKGEQVGLIANSSMLVVNSERGTAADLRGLPVRMTGAAGSSAPAASVLDGVLLDVRPTISADRKYIELRPIPTVTTVTAGSGAPVPTNFAHVIAKLRSYYLPRTRYIPPALTPPVASSTATIPVLEEGTVLIGGLTSKQDAGVTRTPFLGDIPLLGTLFDQRRPNQSGRELVILITATITDTEEGE